MGRNGNATIADFIEDEQEEDENTVIELSGLKGTLKEVLMSLTKREGGILEMRFGMVDGRKRTLEDAGDKYQVTRERIRQIEAKAIRKLITSLKTEKLEFAV